MGLFITFEGPDGSGKSTQIALLKEYLESRGRKPVITREPGGTPISEKLRALILDKENGEMTAETEAFLYAAARAQHVAELIRPELERGGIVISDRYVDSSIAYQAYGRGLGGMVADINRYATFGIMPDLTILIEVAPEEGRRRRTAVAEEDRIESEADSFHGRVLEGFKAVASDPENAGRVIEIDGSLSVDEISAIIRDAVEKLI